MWILAFLATLAAGWSVSALRLLWPRATKITFALVQLMLRPFGTFSGDPVAMTIGSHRFSVEIAPTCSGLEGLGLILAFTVVWLILFRHECRFPQALILLPVGMIVLFLLNSARIASLILIGNAGFSGIALGGFHSQAGWLAFNFVALGTCVAAREVNWISARQSVRPEAAPGGNVSNPTAAWVLPFVVILAVGMLSRAMTASFEWLYPLRFFAAAITLWAFRRQYARLDWRVDWTGPAAGLLVFGIWIALDRSAVVPMPTALAAAPLGIRYGWLALRVLAATVTVPIAEELAFRGFLMRRFVSAQFDEVSFCRFSWLAVLASSLLFGLLHGSRWIAGSLAGVAYASVVVRRGRLGNAVLAHATTNALLALDVLFFHHWALW
jgi:exosortase E/protease (VPEID-CTERM system)